MKHDDVCHFGLKLLSASDIGKLHEVLIILVRLLGQNIQILGKLGKYGCKR